MQQNRTLKKMNPCLRSQEWISNPLTTNNKIMKPQMTIKMNVTSTKEPKKLATRLKIHSRAMMIYIPRKKNLNSY